MSSQKDATPSNDQVVIVEEKITNVMGEANFRRYARGKLLGKGGFAKCFEFTNLETKKLYASKIIQKSSLQKQRAKQKLLSEIKIHRSLHQTNVVNFEHVFEDTENVYILLELCTNQTLNELIKRRRRLVDIEVQCYTVQIINALKYLHKNRVIHRDLKLGNLFLSDKMEVKLGDFGLATKLEFDNEKKRTVCGTPNYIAPEILEAKAGHSYEVDIWSLGVIIYTLLIGKPPFETPDVKTTYQKIKKGTYSFPENVPITESAKNLITKILVLDPSKRPSLEEIMSHPFINNGGAIPKLLPLSTLAMPPSDSYIKQFAPKIGASATGKGGKDSTINFGATQGGDKKYFGSSATSSNLHGGGQDFQRSGSTISKGELGGTTSGKPRSNEVYVKKWVDYSSKYGLGYLLSNGSSGVFFNDCSKILLDPAGQNFEYIERKGSEKLDIMTSHTLKDYPKDLQKKVTLLTHFRSYLEGEGKPANPAESEETEKKPNNNVVYVKKWMKTRHAIMFRLSNKIVQVDFTDKTEIILSSEQKMVTYVNKKGERSEYPLSNALDSSNSEMAKRLKYTKEILTHMLNNGSTQTAPTANPSNAPAS